MRAVPKLLGVARRSSHNTVARRTRGARATGAMAASAAAAETGNPLLAPSPFPLWAQIQPKHVVPAVKASGWS